VTFRVAQLVSVVTATAVFLCGIICACGGTLLAADIDLTPCHAQAAPVEKGCCHSKHETRHEAPAQPAPCHGAHACGHCNAALSASPNVAKVLDLSSLTWIPTPPHSAFAGWNVASFFARMNIAGDPSPPGERTLLSLHCALNT
jgi:hypothetical protein